MRISHQTWLNYIKKLDAIDSKAADMMQEWVEANGLEDRQALVEYAYALTTKYGEAAAALACEMYDATALASGVTLPAAVPAETPTIEEVGRAVNGSLRHSQAQVPSTVYRLTKQSAADTTLQNAARDGAQFAWIPYGDTCPFCITLASRGWQYMSNTALKGGHAEHIHANCDCQYGVRFSEKDSVAGYDPKVYEDMYYGAEGSTPQERINSMRRSQYRQNRDHINEMKRAAYARRKILEHPIGDDIITHEEDILIPGNAGAKFKDTLVELPDGTESRLTPHTRIEQVQTIAGFGRERQIDQVDTLVYVHRETANSPELWKKQKGFGYVDYMGESYKAELHWYNHPLTGNTDYKVKPDSGGNWFYDD